LEQPKEEEIVVAKKDPGTSMIAWDRELAEAAKASAAQVAGLGGGPFFSIRAGTLSVNGSPIPNNEMAVVVLDHVAENVFYGSEYDPDNAGSPGCYAFGRDPATLAPMNEAPEKVSAQCKGCPNNEFGSAEKGRGKACKNRFRLACIPAGTLTNGRFEAFDDPEAFSSAQVAYLGVPPTSIAAWGAYVKSLAGALKRPPFGVFTKIKVVPDPKKQLAVTFELLGPAPAELAGVLMKAHESAKENIIFPYPERDAAPAKPVKKRRF